MTNPADAIRAALLADLDTIERNPRMSTRVEHRCRSCGRRSGREELRRDVYLGQRTIGDYQALRRDRLGRRLVRRYVTRSLMRSLWGN